MESHKLQGSTSKEVTAMNSNEYYQQNKMQHLPEEDEIDLAELWHAIWSGKLLIIAISAFFAVSSIIYAINQPNIYRASTLLVPASQQGGPGGMAKMAGQFGGLANLAGINLNGGDVDKTDLTLEVLKSRAFIESFINEYELLIPLFAAKSWDDKTNSLIFDENIYDYENKAWVRDVKPPKKPKPSPWESFEKFKDVLFISLDKDTGMVTISIEYYSPELARKWLFYIVEKINSTIREQDKTEAQTSIDYLTKKLQETQLADMQMVFYQLIEEQIKIIMLAEVSKEYVLKTIDPPQVPDEKLGPKRGLIILLSTFFGGAISIFIVIIRYFSNKK